METPKLIFDMDQLICNIFRFTKTAKSILKNKKIQVFYAVKANNSKEVLDTIFAYGIGAEVLSSVELNTVPSNIPVQVNGHYKSNDLLVESCQRADCCINLESIDELYRILDFQTNLHSNCSIKIGIRLCIGNEARIGFCESDIPKLISIIQRNPIIQLTSIHFHSGWNLTDDKTYEDILKKMLTMHWQLSEYNINISNWNFGGSFSEHGSWPKQLVTRLKLISSYIPKDVTSVCFEPGRYFTGDAGRLVSYVIEKRHNQFIINSSTYGYMLTGGTPCIEHISNNLQDKEILYPTSTNSSICISGIWPSENDYIKLCSHDINIEVGDKIVFNNMGAYIDGTYSNLFHEKILSYEFYGNLHLILRNSDNTEKSTITKYYQNGQLIIPKNKKDKLVILNALAKQLSFGEVYLEKNLNEILSKFSSDYCFVRREMVINDVLKRYHKYGDVYYERNY